MQMTSSAAHMQIMRASNATAKQYKRGVQRAGFPYRIGVCSSLLCVDGLRMPRVRRRNPYQHVSAFDRGRIVAYRDCGLSCRETAARVGRHPTTVMRIWNRWVQEGRTERREGSERPRHTTAREDRRLVRMAHTDRTATSRTLAQELGCAAQQQVSARTVRRRLQRRGLFARRPLLRLPLTLQHRRLRLQWCAERRTWTHEWHDIVFSDESRFCLQHHDGRIRVWRHRGDRLLESCIMHRHTGPAPGVLVWGAIGYNSRSRLVRISGTLTSQRYISEVLEPVVVPYLQGRRGATYQQDNARPHVARNVLHFLDGQHVPLLPWPARSPDLSPIEHVWSMVSQRLARQRPPAATVDELWQRIEASWTAIPQADIRSLFHSLPGRVAAVIAAHGGHTRY